MRDRLTRSTVSWKIGSMIRIWLTENAGLSILRCLRCCSPDKFSVSSVPNHSDQVDENLPSVESRPGPNKPRLVLLIAEHARQAQDARERSRDEGWRLFP